MEVYLKDKPSYLHYQSRELHLNGVYISKVHKFLAESSSVTTHALEFTDPFNEAHTLINLL